MLASEKRQIFGLNIISWKKAILWTTVAVAFQNSHTLRSYSYETPFFQQRPYLANHKSAIVMQMMLGAKEILSEIFRHDFSEAYRSAVQYFWNQ
jgi:hypothetical protein